MKLHKFLYVALLLGAPSIASAQVANVAFTNAAQTVPPGTVSAAFTLQAQDGSGNAVAGGIPQTGCIALTSTSPSGQFSSSATSWSPVSVVTMNKGTSNRNFYYQDAMAGTYTISATFALKPSSETESCANWPTESWSSTISASQSVTIGSGDASQNTGNSGSESDNSDTSSTTSQSDELSQTQVTTGGGGGGPPPITAHIAGPATVIAGGGSFWSAQAYDTAGNPLSGARYLWNFGDGATDDSQTTMHAYAYPGTYEIVLTAASGYSAVESEAAVTSVAPQLGLLAEPDGSLEVLNETDKNIDLGLWSIAAGTSTFVIPEHTALLSKGSLRFAPAVMGLSGGLGATLYFENGVIAAKASATPPAQSTLAGQGGVVLTPAGASAPHAATQPVSASPVPSKMEEDSEVPVVGSSSAAALPESGVSLPWWLYVAGIAGALMLGIAAAWYVRAGKDAAPRSETAPLGEEFTIE